MSASLSKSEIEKMIRQGVRDELSSLSGKKLSGRRDWDRMVSDQVKDTLEKELAQAVEKALEKPNSKTDKAIREIVSDVLAQYHRALWVRRNFWQNDTKR